MIRTLRRRNCVGRSSSACEEANDCLRRGPYAVTDNEALPPSGDKHDYVSYGVYWWPDPKKTGRAAVHPPGRAHR